MKKLMRLFLLLILLRLWLLLFHPPLLLLCFLTCCGSDAGGADSIPGRSMWGLWQKMCNWDSTFSQFVAYLSGSFHHFYIRVLHSPTAEATQAHSTTAGSTQTHSSTTGATQANSPTTEVIEAHSFTAGHT